MPNVRVKWTLPRSRANGNPLTLAEISGAEIAISGDGGANFTVTDALFPTDVSETVFTDLESGEWFFRGVVVDTAGRRSNPVIASILVPFPDENSPPGELILELSFVAGGATA